MPGRKAGQLRFRWLSAAGLLLAGIPHGCGGDAPDAEVQSAYTSDASGSAEASDSRGPGRARKERGKRGDRENVKRGSGAPAETTPGSTTSEPRLRLDDLAGGPASEAGASWWTEITDEVGLDVTHVAGTTEGFHLPQIIGSGAALFDRNGDGDLDLYLVHGGPDPAEPTEREGLLDRLFENEDGRFLDVTEEAGLSSSSYGQGVAVGDIDNDGDDDVFLANWGPDQLFRNGGDGTFAEVTKAAGIAPETAMSTSAAFFDMDRDGFLDLFVARYVDYLPGKRCFDFADRHDYCGPSAFDPIADKLYRNQGDGTFVDVSSTAGLNSRKAAGLGVVCLDLNEDGWQDVFVSNDGYENHLWVNQEEGRFVEDGVILGVAFNQSGHAEAGMGVLAEDFDGDGHVDLFLTHLANETNTLYRNLGGGAGFVDWTGRSGLGSSSLALTGFGTAAIDAELDGDLDLLVVNGRVKRGPEFEGAAMGDHWNDYAEPNLFYVNEGRGRFASGRDRASTFTDRLEVSRGLTVGDIDGDSDLDLVVTGLDGRARVFRNDAPRSGHGLLVEAFEPAFGRDAIGARVRLVTEERTFVRHVGRSQGYLTSNDPRLHFGVGTLSEDELASARLLVLWPDGSEERFAVPGWDRTVRLVRGEGETVE